MVRRAYLAAVVPLLLVLFAVTPCPAGSLTFTVSTDCNGNDPNRFSFSERYSSVSGEAWYPHETGGNADSGWSSSASYSGGAWLQSLTAGIEGYQMTGNLVGQGPNPSGGNQGFLKEEAKNWLGVSYNWSGQFYGGPGPSEERAMIMFSSSYQGQLIQGGDVRFTDAYWLSRFILYDSTRQIVDSMYIVNHPADTAGETISGNTGGGLMFSFPVTWWEREPGLWQGSGSWTGEIDLVMEQGGHTDLVPIPGALLLLGSGLLGLAAFGRKKFPAD